ncbi:unnamed protein product [Symbiodinium pilosum]|uniref:Uncharacterized protein n=1 Tax=Symbiodinium pilosum TaxID=2952 RepID=A0A812MTF5_SYMPI|nr:unnamed protein product [Symbiodinium pilosum]
MGLGAWPLQHVPQVANHTKRRLEGVLDKEFQLLLPFFQKAEAPSATVAWVPHKGRPVVLTKGTNGWAPAALSFTQVNVLMFLIAVAFNLVVAFTVSAAFLMTVLLMFQEPHFLLQPGAVMKPGRLQNNAETQQASLRM